MRRFLVSASLAVVAVLAIGATAAAAATPVITSFSPKEVRVGQTLVINGKNFRKGVKNNRVFFFRASDGKAVRARPSSARSSRRMSVVVPATVTKLLNGAPEAPVATRFQLEVFSGSPSKKTPKSRSPMILPANASTNEGPGTVGTTPPPPADCDADGTPDSTDNDDDNDGLSDDVEAGIHTDPCKKDTDGDGVDDAYEYYASLDLNQNPNYAGKRPYPNPLDATDAGKDFDGDGLTMAEEFAASVKFGSAITAPLTYSDGNQRSAAPNNVGAMDLDQNGAITDDEKDADNDGLPNWVEMAKTEKAPPSNGYSQPASAATCTFTGNTGPQAAPSIFATTDRFTLCNSVTVPNGNTFTQLGGTRAEPWYFGLDWLDADSDGDGIPDGADDQDHDSINNIEEITAGGDSFYTNPIDPCDPNENAPLCERHTR